MPERELARMRELAALLNRASEAYYQHDASIMTDYEYDRLYDEYAALERETGITLPDSPTARVGYEVVSGLAKVRHETPMLSLDKTKSVERLAAFLSEGAGLLSLKLDGLTIALRYDGGELRQAVTRGNGEIGEDITHNARVFKNLPKSLSFGARLVVRGEAVISYTSFERINSALGEGGKYKNPRNLCSGSVRQLDSRVAAERGVDFLAFSLVSAEGMDFSSKSKAAEWLAGLGFGVVPGRPVDAGSVTEAVADFSAMLDTYDYACDGLVLTYDNIALSASLGRTSKFPRDSIAFKWADERGETVLKDILWNTSRTGLINPIAIFEPVELEGTTVERASLHNLSIVEGLELGIGDRITVYKANMIIPQVADNLTRSNTARPPGHCAQCGGPALAEENDGVKVVYCHNPNCHARLVRTIAHYASRDAMNIVAFSEQTIEKFIGLGFLENYADIYDLARHRDAIIAERGFGQKSYDRLTDNIEKSKNAALPNFIYGLGIDNVGLANAKLLCKHCGYDLSQIRRAETEELVTIEGFGEVIAANLSRYFADPRNIAIMERALEHIRFTEATDAGEPGMLSGKTFVVTGDTRIYANRRELKAAIERLGGKVAGSVSGKTDYLINNDITSASSKNKKATELDVSVITEEDFARIIGDTNSF